MVFVCYDKDSCLFDLSETVHLKVRYKAVRNFWCKLPLNHRTPVLWDLGDGNGLSRSTLAGLSSYRVPIISQSEIYSLSVTMDDPIDLTKTVLFPDFEFIKNEGYKEVLQKFQGCQTSFSCRRDAIFFRGSSTGYVPSNLEELDRNTRMHAVRVTFNRSGWDVRLTNTAQLSGKVKEAVATYYLGSHTSLCGFMRYKAVLDLDGNSNSWKELFTKLHMGSVVFKVESSYRQWYYHKLIPGKHFHPIHLSEEVIRTLPHNLSNYTPTNLQDTPIQELSYEWMTHAILRWWQKYKRHSAS